MWYKSEVAMAKRINQRRWSKMAMEEGFNDYDDDNVTMGGGDGDSTGKPSAYRGVVTAVRPQVYTGYYGTLAIDEEDDDEDEDRLQFSTTKHPEKWPSLMGRALPRCHRNDASLGNDQVSECEDWSLLGEDEEVDEEWEMCGLEVKDDLDEASESSSGSGEKKNGEVSLTSTANSMATSTTAGSRMSFKDILLLKPNAPETRSELGLPKVSLAGPSSTRSAAPDSSAAAALVVDDVPTGINADAGAVAGSPAGSRHVEDYDLCLYYCDSDVEDLNRLAEDGIDDLAEGIVDTTKRRRDEIRYRDGNKVPHDSVKSVWKKERRIEQKIELQQRAKNEKPLPEEVSAWAAADQATASASNCYGRYEKDSWGNWTCAPPPKGYGQIPFEDDGLNAAGYFMGQVCSSGGNVPSGYGTYRYHDGDHYEGQWAWGQFHGWGVYTSQGARASWQDQRKTMNVGGRQRYLGLDGAVYLGQWSLGAREGRGVLRYADGSFYKGEWKGDKRHGQGQQRWANGSSYDGEWKGGRRDGRGVYKNDDGDVLEGQWKADKWVGGKGAKRR